MRTHQHPNKREIGWICTQVEVGSQRERKDRKIGGFMYTQKCKRAKRVFVFH